MTEVLKKLSAKTIIGGPADVRKLTDPAGGDTVPLFSVVGIVRGTKTGETDHGPWTALRGQFAIVRSHDNAEFAGAVLFLPDVALDMVLGTWDGDMDGLEFGFEIGARADDKAAVGYEYTCRPLLKPAENDPLEALKRQALPAPEKPASGRGRGRGSGNGDADK